MSSQSATLGKRWLWGVDGIAQTAGARLGCHRNVLARAAVGATVSLVLGVCVAAVSPVAAAAATVSPTLGRWEGGARGAAVVFTVERTATGRRYVVRPVVYCGADNAVNYETGLFSLFQPDAWPIAGSGTVRDGPLQGRFADSRSAALRFTGSARCLPRGARVRAGSAPAVTSVADGSWNVAVAPHTQGLIGEVTDFTTRSEGALIDSDWGVYDGGLCFFLRSAVKLLVDADGGFSASINGNALATNFVTIHLGGGFASGQTAEGFYSLTGPGCSGTPVAFTATFASAYERPRPSDGGGTPLLAPPPSKFNAAGAAAWARANATRSTNPYRYPNDCTDFVSRALHLGGGLPERDTEGLFPFNHTDDRDWYMRFLGARGVGRWVGTFSWGDSLHLLAFLKNNGLARQVSLQAARPGDVIFVNWGKGGRDLPEGQRDTSSPGGISHVGMIVGNPGSRARYDVQIAQHTNNVIERLSDWRKPNPNLHFWIYSIRSQ